MKKNHHLAFLIILYSVLYFHVQGQSLIPDVQIKTIDGENTSSNVFQNEGKPFIVCFWKSCCNSSLKFMGALNEVYPDLVEDYSIKVFAIAIDDSRTSARIKPLVNGNNWEFDFYLDANMELARAMNISLTPHCIVYDGANNIIWKKSVCMEGDESVIEGELNKLNDQ